jgi:hypothetical protein
MGDEKQTVLKSKTRKKLIRAFLHGYNIELLNYSTIFPQIIGIIMQ